MNDEAMKQIIKKIEEISKTGTYMQVVGILNKLTQYDLEEVQDICLIMCSPNAYEKVQKAIRYIKSKRVDFNSQTEQNNFVNNVISKLDIIPIEQLKQIRKHLKSKEVLTKNEKDFASLLDNKINERNGKVI